MEKRDALDLALPLTSKDAEATLKRAVRPLPEGEPKPPLPICYALLTDLCCFGAPVELHLCNLAAIGYNLRIAGLGRKLCPLNWNCCNHLVLLRTCSSDFPSSAFNSY